MAQGIEVLQAALAGKRVRPLGEVIWRQWDADHNDLMTEEGVRFREINPIFTLEWEIEPDPPMTFAEVVVAIDAGHTVEHRTLNRTKYGPRYLVQFRKSEDDYEERYQAQVGAWSNWGIARFDAADLHATDWHIVEEGPAKSSPDARPTQAEYLVWLTRYVSAHRREFTEDLRREIQRAAAAFPEMFREEAIDADA